MMDRELCMHRLVLPLQFPAGLAPGAGKDLSNSLQLSQDGLERPVLRGTSLAGVLRHAYARLHDLPAEPLSSAPMLRRWFGEALGSDRGSESPLRVADCVLDVGKGPRRAPRTHNAMVRHDRAPRDGGLFRLEALPPGTKATAVLHLLSDDPDAVVFLREVVGLFHRGLAVGGSVARGIGRAELAGPARHRSYSLRRAADRAAWLDASWKWRSSDQGIDPKDGAELLPADLTADLVVTLRLVIPRGQDLCIADGRGAEYEAEPQSIRDAQGATRWRLPGSALRGVFRSWMTRLAAREGQPVQDSLTRYRKDGRGKGDAFGWGFRDAGERSRIQDALRKDPAALDSAISCPIERLFGTLFHASRFQIADALSLKPANPELHCSVRKHVAVDRISGGARDGLLFDHQALIAGVEFETTISIRDAQAHEARWLAQSLRALELGLLRFGSSKSVGSLSLAGPVNAMGTHASEFLSLHQKETRR